MNLLLSVQGGLFGARKLGPVIKGECFFMFSLRRCCIGAALGLSLLACRPAEAIPLPVNNPNFHTSAGAVTAWNGANWSFFGSAAHWNHPSTGILFQKTSTTLKSTQTYTFSFNYAVRGTGKILAGFNWYTGSFFGVAANHVGSGTLSGTFKHTYTGAAIRAKSHRGAVFFNVTGDAAVGHLNAPVPGSLATAPEIDGQTAAAPLALALGGLALMTERRRRALEVAGEAVD